MQNTVTRITEPTKLLLTTIPARLLRKQMVTYSACRCMCTSVQAPFFILASVIWNEYGDCT